MVDIPNTTTSGLVLTSVGNGTNASKWGTAGSGGSGITALTGDVIASGTGSVVATVKQIQTIPVSSTTPNTTGQIMEYSSTGQWTPNNIGGAAPYTGQILVYNSGTADWVPSSVTVSVSGDVSGLSSSTIVGKIQGQPVNVTGSVSGDVLYYNGTTWVPQSLPGTAISNNAWSSYQSTAVGMSNTGSAPTAITSVTVNGFTQYLINWSIPQTTTTAGAYGFLVYVYDSVTSSYLVSQTGGYLSTTTTSYPVFSGSAVVTASSTTNHTFTLQGQINNSTGSCNVRYATLSVVGIS